jgi:DNA-binding NtrC family response regulator
MARILLVDDDTGILKSMKMILGQKGYEVDTAENGTDGLSKIANEYYHLAVFDMKLPDMDGTELLEKAHKLRPKMKKIMLTGFASVENSVKSINTGADAFLLKPVVPNVLIQMIEEKLAEQQNEGEIDEQKVSDFLEEKLLGIRR